MITKIVELSENSKLLPNKILLTRNESNSDWLDEGIGLIIKETSANYFNNGNVIFSIVTKLDKNEKYKDAINPF